MPCPVILGPLCSTHLFLYMLDTSKQFLIGYKQAIFLYGTSKHNQICKCHHVTRNCRVTMTAGIALLNWQDVIIFRISHGVRSLYKGSSGLHHWVGEGGSQWPLVMVNGRLSDLMTLSHWNKIQFKVGSEEKNVPPGLPGGTLPRPPIVLGESQDRRCSWVFSTTALSPPLQTHTLVEQRQLGMLHT